MASFSIYTSLSQNLTQLGFQVGVGLSNAINTVATTLPSEISLTSGAIEGQMIADFGLNTNLTGSLTNINANVTINGMNSVTNLVGHVINGVINSSNLSVFSDPALVLSLAGINPTLFNGALVDTANIYSLLGLQSDLLNPPTSFDVAPTLQSPSEMPVKSQAAQLAQSALIPKQKFNFIMEISLNSGYQIRTIATNMTFLLKSFNRPDVNIEYDDVNFYNFRTKVAKKITYQPVLMHFIDDDSNVSMRLLVMLMRAYSPIFNLNSSINYENAAMDFAETPITFRGTSKNNAYSASLGPLQTSDLWKNIDSQPAGASQDATTPINFIKIYHVYNACRNVNIYTYFNPRPIVFTMDDLSHADYGEGCQLSLSFGYDGLYIEEGATAQEHKEAVEVDLNGVGFQINPYGGDPSDEDSPFGPNTETTFNPLSQSDAQNDPFVGGPYSPEVEPGDSPIASDPELLGPGDPTEEGELVGDFNTPPTYA